MQIKVAQHSLAITVSENPCSLIISFFICLPFGHFCLTKLHTAAVNTYCTSEDHRVGGALV